MSLQQLREKRAQLGQQIKGMAVKIGNENRSFTPEEDTHWKAMNAEFDSLGQSIAIQERADSVTAELERRNENIPGNEDTSGVKSRKGKREDRERRKQEGKKFERANALALQAWLFRGSDVPLTDEHREACKYVGFNPRSRFLNINLPKNYRAQSVGTTTAGGFTVPTGFVSTLEKAMKDFDAVRSVAQVIRTDSGEALPWPTVNDTAQTGELLAENTAIASQDVTFGQTTFNAYKFSSKLVLVSYELMVDSAIQMANELALILGERLGRIQSTYFTTGTGPSQPGGIVTGSTLGKTAASATAIAADELYDLYHSVDPAYRRDPSFGFMMHDNILLAVRKLKDSQNRYLWEPSMKDGTPEKLLNAPVYVNQNMQSSIATATKTILAGAFSKYKIRDAGPVRLKRLDERYGEYDQVGFMGFQRSDGKVLNAGGNPIKHLVQA